MNWRKRKYYQYLLKEGLTSFELDRMDAEDIVGLQEYIKSSEKKESRSRKIFIGCFSFYILSSILNVFDIIFKFDSIGIVNFIFFIATLGLLGGLFFFNRNKLSGFNSRFFMLNKEMLPEHKKQEILNYKKKRKRAENIDTILKS
jgi:hypothetical protein